MPAAAFSVARHAPIGKPPPMPLADAMMSGVDAVMLVGVERAGARDAALHLVEHQHQVMLVAGRAQARQELLRRRADAALALDRLDQEAGGILVDRRQRRVEIVELDDLEARQQRREAVDASSPGRSR